jgi:hypothetical protein
VIWRHDDDNRHCDFKIIHQRKCDRKDYGSSLAVEDFLGPKGLTIFLSFLSVGPIKQNLGQSSRNRIRDMDEFVDLVRRFQIPYYEEARRRFSDSEILERMSDANEVYPYQPQVLQNLAAGD